MTDTRSSEHAGNLSRFDADGYLVLGRLTGRLLDNLQCKVDAVADGLSERHLLSALHHHPELITVIDWPPILSLVVELLSSNVHVNHSHLDIHPPHHPTSGRRWHRDGGVQGREMRLMPVHQPRVSVKVGVFLSDVERPDDGALELVPGSHRDPSTRRPDVDPPDSVAVTVAAGAVVLFDSRTWHRRRDNLGQTTRKALFLSYSYRWIASREVPFERFPGRAHLGELHRQLLGDGQWDAFYPPPDQLPADTWIAAWRSIPRPTPAGDGPSHHGATS